MIAFKLSRVQAPGAAAGAPAIAVVPPAAPAVGVAGDPAIAIVPRPAEPVPVPAIPVGVLVVAMRPAEPMAGAGGGGVGAAVVPAVVTAALDPAVAMDCAPLVAVAVPAAGSGRGALEPAAAP